MKKRMVIAVLAVCMLMGCRKGEIQADGPEDQNTGQTSQMQSQYTEEIQGKQEFSKTDGEEKEESSASDAAGAGRNTAGEDMDSAAGAGQGAEEGTSKALESIVLTEEKKEQIEEALVHGEFAYAPILLEEVTAYLEESGIRYEGCYTSAERVDMTLEDGTVLLFLETEDSDMISFGYELIMAGDHFNRWNFQENYHHCYDVCDDQYYYPELSERVFTEEEFNDFNKTDLSIARNELFAKHGRSFADPFFKQVFAVKSWYEPTISAAEFDGRRTEILTDIEEKNVQTIIACESARGFRKKDPEALDVRMLVSGSWIDLDGDGKKEQICCSADHEEDGDGYGVAGVVLTVCSENGESRIALGEDDGYEFHDKCFITSMDGVHHYLILMDYGPSADYMSFLYSYEEGTLKEAGRMACHARALKVYEDRILAPTETYHLQCQPVDFVYVLQRDKFVYQPSEYYEYRGNTVTATREVPLFATKEEVKPSLRIGEGEEVKILGGDLENWVLVEKTDTAERGWLKVGMQTEIWISDEEVCGSDEAFEGLYFYG